MPCRWSIVIIAIGTIGCGADVEPLRPEPEPERGRVVDYFRDIQPILSEHCWNCHGPDEAGREAELRLDTFEGATATREDGTQAIVPGDPDASVLMHRVRDPEPDTRMPPGSFLLRDQIEALEIWIRDGAAYDRHWAYDPPTRPPVPGGADHPVDAFLERRLASEGVEPSTPAEPATLLRRLTLDVTGLPPTPGELDDFLADPSDEAFGAAVDRLLASDRAAEHLARDWLDYAGYTDSGGLGTDRPREVWPYRDWVIDAFRRNRPFDEFIIAQLAGDQVGDEPLGTTFLRLHPTIREGGIVDEEYKIRYAMDRATTVGTQLLGLTVQCAQCHDHRYDPIPQVDFYRLTACFNRISNPGEDLDGRPTVTTPSPLRDELVDALRAERRELEAAGDPSAGQAEWESSLAGETPSWRAPDSLAARAERGATLSVEEGAVAASGESPAGEVYVLELADTEPIRALRLSLGSGRSSGEPVLSEVTAHVDSAEERRRVVFELAETADGEDAAPLVDGDGETDLRLPEQDLFLVPREAIDASEDAPLTLRLDQLAGGGRTFAQIDVAVSADPVATLPPALRAVLVTPVAERDAADATRLADAYARLHAPSDVRVNAQRIAELDRAIDRASATVAIRVMRDDDPERVTHLLERGDYQRPQEVVTCGVPEILTLGEPVEIQDRAELAAWLVSDQSPTTARLLANHYFQWVFGAGLTRTPGDFGSRGEAPTHPELLDWLARELVESGWDLRHLLRLLLTSAAYRRSSHARPDLEAIDPDNRLWARGTARRLDAEVIRDQALFAGGVLVERLGGASFRPYQPPGLYQWIGRSLVYPTDRGVERIHRRSMYTFWRRGMLVPSLELLDAPKRLGPVHQRAATNTPTQALALLNEPLMVEAARHLAARMEAEGGATLDERLAYGFRLVTSRRPRPEELEVLRVAHAEELVEAQATGGLGPLRVGESERRSPDPARHRAMTLVARVLLNLSETITRP